MVGVRTYKKLVRDFIPDIIRANGEVPKTRILRIGEYQEALRAKLIEEAIEFSQAKTRAEKIEELADIQEVMLSLYDAYSIPCAEVTKTARQKRKKRGSFSKKIFLETTSHS